MSDFAREFLVILVCMATVELVISGVLGMIVDKLTGL
jgi:hypothetical protein